MAGINYGIPKGHALSFSTGMAEGLEGKSRNPKSRPQGHGKSYTDGYTMGEKLKGCSLFSDEVFEGICEELKIRKSQKGVLSPLREVQLPVSLPDDGEDRRLLGRMIGIYFKERIHKLQRG